MSEEFEQTSVCDVAGCNALATHGIHGMFNGQLQSYSACAAHKGYWQNVLKEEVHNEQSDQSPQNISSSA